MAPSVDVIRRVPAEHARLAVDPNNVAGTDDPSPAGNGSWWAKKRMMTGSRRRVLSIRRRSTARSTIRMISTSRARVRKARMRRWNYAPLRHDHRRQSAEFSFRYETVWRGASGRGGTQAEALWSSPRRWRRPAVTTSTSRETSPRLSPSSSCEQLRVVRAAGDHSAARPPSPRATTIWRECTACASASWEAILSLDGFCMPSHRA